MAGLRQPLRSTTALGRFAHLLGFPAAAAAAAAVAASAPRAEEPAPSPKEDDVTGSAAAAEAGEDCPECDGSGETEDGEPCEACDGSGKAKKAKKAKGKKASDDEECAEEGDDDEDVAKAAKAGRRFERARCAAIFAADAAAVRPDMAAHLAFETGMSAAAAVALLETAAAGGRMRPAEARRIERPRVDLGAGAPSQPSGAGGMAARIVEAGKRRRGEK